MKTRIVVYSHGFGVSKDNRGMFTDIAAALSDAEHVMFDYNIADDEHNTLTVSSLTKQAMRLAQVLDEVKTANPDAEIDLICHSQGCVVAALLKPQGINKTICIAPPAVMISERMLELFGAREGAVVNTDGLSSFPRRDGSTTIVPSDYWPSVQNLEPISLYNELAKNTALTIINADQDEVLGTTDFSRLDADINVIHINSNHDFTGEVRHKLTAMIYSLLEASN